MVSATVRFGIGMRGIGDLKLKERLCEKSSPSAGRYVEKVSRLQHANEQLTRSWRHMCVSTPGTLRVWCCVRNDTPDTVVWPIRRREIEKIEHRPKRAASRQPPPKKKERRVEMLRSVSCGCDVGRVINSADASTHVVRRKMRQAFIP
uniref:Uncharacterized protein n=1 Tax=Anopheles funestus TaxID=62324 RepID=A0A182R6F6_ANOFN